MQDVANRVASECNVHIALTCAFFYLSSHSHELHCRIKVNVAGLKCFSAQQSGSNSKLVLSESKKN